jgi:hypothetical protein
MPAAASARAAAAAAEAAAVAEAATATAMMSTLSPRRLPVLIACGALRRRAPTSYERRGTGVDLIGSASIGIDEGDDAALFLIEARRRTENEGARRMKIQTWPVRRDPAPNGDDRGGERNAARHRSGVRSAVLLLRAVVRS